MTQDLPTYVLPAYGNDVHYVRAGSGPPVVLLHGVLGSHRSWAQLVSLLAEQVRGDQSEVLGQQRDELRPAAVAAQHPVQQYHRGPGTGPDVVHVVAVRRQHVGGQVLGHRAHLSYQLRRRVESDPFSSAPPEGFRGSRWRSRAGSS